MNKLYSETIHAMYLDYFNDYLTVEKFAEYNLLSVEHATLLLEIGRTIAYDGLKQYQQNQQGKTKMFTTSEYLRDHKPVLQAMPEESKDADIDSGKDEVGLDQFEKKKHKYHLRANFEAILTLPSNLTLKDVNKLHAFLNSLIL